MWMKSGALLIYISSVFNFLYTFSSIHTVWGDFYTPVLWYTNVRPSVSHVTL